MATSSVKTLGVQTEVLEWLRSIGHDPNLPCESRPSKNRPKNHINTAMWEACFAGRLDVCSWLFENGGATTVRTKNNQEVSPFLAACKGGHLHVMVWLFEHGAKEDVSVTDKYCTTPFYEAANMGRLDIVRWLYTNGAACDIKTPEPRSEWRTGHHNGGRRGQHTERFPLAASLYASRNRIETAAWLLIHGAAHGRNGLVDVFAITRDVIHARPGFVWALILRLNQIVLENRNFVQTVLSAVHLSKELSPGTSKRSRHSRSQRKCPWLSRCVLPLLSGHHDTLLPLIADFAGVARGKQLRQARETAKSLLQETDIK